MRISTPVRERLRSAGSQAFAPAVLAAAAGLLAMAAARWLFQLSMPPELAADRATVLIPLPVFESLLKAFGPGAKHLLLASLVAGYGLFLLGCCILWWFLRELGRAGATPIAMRHWPGERADARDLVGVILCQLLLGGLVISPLVGGGLLGVAFNGGAGAALASVLPPAVASALTFVGLRRVESIPASSAGEVSRRAFIQRGAVAAGFSGAAALAWQFITGGTGSLGLGGSQGSSSVADGSLPPQPDKIVPPPTPTYGEWPPLTGQTTEVTPTGEFYYVAKDIVDDPSIDGKTWRLQVAGLVDHPVALSLDELKSFPAVTRYHTLECISNDVGGTLMSNGLFRGARLADVLAKAGVHPAVTSLVFEAQDGYSDALTIEQATDPRSLVVYELNGAPLPVPHGYPARLLIPGLYGMKNGKWLTKLTAKAGDYQGYWEERGWTNIARVKTMTRIDLPFIGRQIPPGLTPVSGVAYAADRGIARVDVSVDGGQTWHESTLKRPLGDLTWVLWRWDWQADLGTHTVIARSVENDGTVQTTAVAPTLPDGASGYHMVQVVVQS